MSKIYIYIVTILMGVLMSGFLVVSSGPVVTASIDCTDIGKLSASGMTVDQCYAANNKEDKEDKAKEPVGDGCAGVDTSIIKCKTGAGDGIEGTGIWSLLLMAINILTAGVGVAALGGVVYGAVLYSSAGGNPEQVKKAKGMFMNVAIGVISFAAMYFLLNFLIPGGVIG